MLPRIHILKAGALGWLFCNVIGFAHKTAAFIKCCSEPTNHSCSRKTIPNIPNNKPCNSNQINHMHNCVWNILTENVDHTALVDNRTNCWKPRALLDRLNVPARAARDDHLLLPRAAPPAES